MKDITKHNQSELIYFVETTNKQLNELRQKYNWSEYNEYDNLQTKYSSLFFDPFSRIAHKKNEDEDTMFKNLTKHQKVIYALNAFEGQVCNGGIYQFFWNTFDFSIAVRQSIEEIGLIDLLNKYDKVKAKFEDNAQILNKLKRNDVINGIKYAVIQFFRGLIGQKTQLRRSGFEDFVEGAEIMKDTEWFDNYFYDIVKQLHIAEVEYIERNINKIVLLKD